MSHFQNQTVLITGGAGGLGRRMGELLLQEGASRLILWDIDAKTLAATAESLRADGFTVETEVVDVSDTAKLLEVAARTPAVDLLINNAAIIVGKNFVEHSHEEIDRTMQINTLALMHLTRALLPGMQQRGSGHIVNIASAAGMVANPQMSVYCASKWAVIGWSDSLRIELERSHPGIHVTTVTPYYINTGMFDGVKSSIIPILQPEATARKIIAGIRGRRLFIRMPGIISTLPLVQGLLPTRWFDLIVGRWLGVYDTMKEFKGRKR